MERLQTDPVTWIQCHMDPYAMAPHNPYVLILGSGNDGADRPELSKSLEWYGPGASLDRLWSWTPIHPIQPPPTAGPAAGPLWNLIDVHGPSMDLRAKLPWTSYDSLCPGPKSRGFP